MNHAKSVLDEAIRQVATPMITAGFTSVSVGFSKQVYELEHNV